MAFEIFAGYSLCSFQVFHFARTGCSIVFKLFPHYPLPFNIVLSLHGLFVDFFQVFTGDGYNKQVFIVCNGKAGRAGEAGAFPAKPNRPRKASSSKTSVDPGYGGRGGTPI